MNGFKKDKNYFLNYFTINAVLFVILDIVFMSRLWTSFEYSNYLLILIPMSLCFGLIMATAFHNTSHQNIRPFWLNTLVGEFCGFYTLIGMRPFRVGHMLHHMHTDDPEHDPHPPKGLSFTQFIMKSHKRTIDILKLKYKSYHGDTKSTALNLRAQEIVYQIGFLAKLLFIYLSFGPTLFIFIYIPSYLAYFFGFAHLNYVSHLPDDDGVTRIKDHADGPFYIIMNVLTSGGYFHKSHHLYPKRYNPSISK
jgi:stearoyl-CoA desaturase (delta-9 desaturase)